MNLINSSFKEFPMLPYPIQQKNEKTLIHEEVNYNETQIRGEFLQLYNGLNIHQRNVFEASKRGSQRPKSGSVFRRWKQWDGKNISIQSIGNRIKTDIKKIYTSGFIRNRVTLFVRGRTSHSMFKIPLQLGKDSVCGIRKGTYLVELMCKADLIIWDEATMVHKHAFEALDRTFKDMMSNPIKIFGGKTIVLGGYFRQILPTTPEGTRKMTVDASINRSKLWRYFRIFSLGENMRIISGVSSATKEK